MEENILVRRSSPPRGHVKIDGAKNSALPLLAASLLGTEEIILEDVPQLVDVGVMIEVLKHLGSKVEYIDEGTLRINSREINSYQTPYDLMDKMRASFLVMGPLLARLGRTQTVMPGGCAIGARPVDLHLKGFHGLGAEIDTDTSVIGAHAKEGLIGDVVYLDFPSVGATQNIMMAAVQAKGTSTIENAAKEPEIVDLANFLNKMGAKVRGAGTSTIKIEGVEKLTGTRHQIIPDRIEASTFLVASAINKGDIVVENVISSHIKPVIAKLKEMGCEIDENEEKDEISIKGPDLILPTNIKTMPYPGFPTDCQAQFMALMAVAKGSSKVEETVFENRFMHVDELIKMGAVIATEGKEARIAGVDMLKGAQVRATDLRAGAALVLAGTVAEGQTEVYDIYHIDRGYYNFVEKLNGIGIDAERIGK